MLSIDFPAFTFLSRTRHTPYEAIENIRASFASFSRLFGSPWPAAKAAGLTVLYDPYAKKRGMIYYNQDRRAVIRLSKRGTRVSLIHELAHFVDLASGLRAGDGPDMATPAAVPFQSHLNWFSDRPGEKPLLVAAMLHTQFFQHHPNPAETLQEMLAELAREKYRPEAHRYISELFARIVEFYAFHKLHALGEEHPAGVEEPLYYDPARYASLDTDLIDSQFLMEREADILSMVQERIQSICGQLKNSPHPS